MKSKTAGSIARHVAATVAATALLMGECFLGYRALQAVSQDPGGPMVLGMVLAGALGVGLIVSVALFLPASLLVSRLLLQGKTSTGPALAIVYLSILIASALLLLAVRNNAGASTAAYVGTVAAVWFLVSTCFTAYWLIVRPKAHQRTPPPFPTTQVGLGTRFNESTRSNFPRAVSGQRSASGPDSGASGANAKRKPRW